MSNANPHAIRGLSNDALECREALYLNLLRNQTGVIAEQLYLRLCEVRLVMFERS